MIELQGKFGKDCKIFTNAIENEAIGTIQNILNNPVTTGVPVRIMPDTHQGVDIVIGFTMPVTDRVNPNHIGVDIGCGMLCVEIENAITEESFPDINHAIRSIIPMGFEINQQPLSKQEKEDLFTFLSIRMDQFCSKYQLTKPVINEEYVSQLCKKVGINEGTFYNSLGTLGGGNHFIELGRAESTNNIFLTIHTGSRNFGVKVCKYHAEIAKFDKKAFSNEIQRLKSTVEPQFMQTEILRLKEKFAEYSGSVAAVPYSGYQLVSFTGGPVGGSSSQFSGKNQYSFNIQLRDWKFTVSFKKEYTVTVSAGTGGTVSGGGKVLDGSSCTVTARANSGYSFDGWYEGSSKVSSSASYTFTVSSNRTLCFHLT